ncbi:glycosyltransferase family 2 protein [Natronosporangium hydrolyticum]|uniref:Glycosyltransferase family 2 protein n=1 Tax=Natronosporangium hydrolyticum TaxID=2811111 RepID=A0A895YCN5_9ACTN|nr:glycosyltransferase family 2 protein [Natronosporangium hydrolyticum]QSB15261.1 glycosyltransferase family 2 protein [Natronosporangium hydrolyticum]
MTSDAPPPVGNDWGGLQPPSVDNWRPTTPVSVIIPARQCPETLPLVLAGLAHQTYPSELLEVVVVDDGSEPKLELPELAPANCRIVRAADHSTGWGRANALHVGVSVSDGEILHWLDADVVPFPDHVAAQARWHHAAPGLVTLGYKRFVSAPLPAVDEVTRRAAAGTLGELFPHSATEPHDYVEELIDGTEQLRAADHLAFRAHVGATAALRRDLYQAAGGLDTSLRLGEDSEFGYRLAQAGAVFVPEPQSRSWHLGPSHAMRVGQRIRRHNRPYLADRMPLPRWLRGPARRVWAVPLVTAVVTVNGAPAEQVQACVDRLLGSDEYDLRVLLVGDWSELSEQRRSVLDDPLLDLRLVAAAYRSEPRVSLVSTAPTVAFPSPYLLRVPVQLGVAPRTVRRLVADADTWRAGVVQLLPGGTGTGPAPAAIELWRTAAVNRARRWLPQLPLPEAVARAWGSRWVGGEAYGVVDLTAAAAVPPGEANAASPAGSAPTPSPEAATPRAATPGPVMVAGLRSWLRATRYVGRLAMRRAYQRMRLLTRRFG